MMAMVRELEAKLTPTEQRDREFAFEQLRRFIRRVAAKGGTTAFPSKSFKPSSRGEIRVDIEVLKGIAGIPDKVG